MSDGPAREEMRLGFPRDEILGSNPTIISIQPEPMATRVVYFRFLGFVVTAIMRHWKSGDSGPNGRCRLCPKCKAYGDGCLMIFGKKIAREDAGLVTSIGLVRPAQPLPARGVIGKSGGA